MNTETRARAFSLVELVIVVVIIGVIAAIAVPRISRGAKGAGESSTRMSLTGLRNAIDMYAAEHGGTFPGSDGLEATLIDQLTKKTDGAGNVGVVAGTHIYGPYLRGGFPPIPVGPNVGATGVELFNIALVVNEVLTTKGWLYQYETGEIMANTNDTDEKGNGFDTY